MMMIWLMLMLTAVAWAHARLTLVVLIHQTQTADEMLNRMCTDTVLFVIMVIVCYYPLGTWGHWMVLYGIAKLMFLWFTNWAAVCDNYQDIKRLLDGN